MASKASRLDPGSRTARLHASAGELAMEISIDKQSKAVIVVVKGRIDGVSAPEFEKTMADHIASGASRFVVDCSALEYISSAGLRSLLTTAKTLKARGGEL